MRIEAANKSIEARVTENSGVISPLSVDRLKRGQIVGISGIDIPVKSLNPKIKFFRPRRRSRCDGMHDAEEKPCGSPRCRTKGRSKLNGIDSKQFKTKNLSKAV